MVESLCALTTGHLFTTIAVKGFEMRVVLCRPNPINHSNGACNTLLSLYMHVSHIHIIIHACAIAAKPCVCVQACMQMGQQVFISSKASMHDGNQIT